MALCNFPAVTPLCVTVFGLGHIIFKGETAMNYTRIHHLPQWASSDRIQMDDFNDAMANIESGLANATSIAKAAQAAATAAYSPDNRPFVTGSYTGDGARSQRIELNFKPSLVIISGITENTDASDYSSISPYFAITADNTNVRGRVQLHVLGFTVYFAGNYDLQLPSLNERDRHYDYIAFR